MWITSEQIGQSIFLKVMSFTVILEPQAAHVTFLSGAGIGGNGSGGNPSKPGSIGSCPGAGGIGNGGKSFKTGASNTGNVPLTGLSLVEGLTDGNSSTLTLDSGPTFVSNSSGSAQGALAVGEFSTYTSTYTISQNAANTGKIVNTVFATSSSPGNTNDVTDRSDDGDDSDGNTTDDPTEVITVSNATIEVTKTAVITQNDGTVSYTHLTLPTKRIV